MSTHINPLSVFLFVFLERTSTSKCIRNLVSSLLVLDRHTQYLWAQGSCSVIIVRSGTRSCPALLEWQQSLEGGHLAFTLPFSHGISQLGSLFCPLLCACTKPEGFGQLRRWAKLLSVLGWWPISWRDGGCPWAEKQQRWWRRKELHPRWESLGGINMEELGSTFPGLSCLHGQLCWKVWSSQIHILVP